MNEQLHQFQQSFNNHLIEAENKNLNNVIQKYDFLFIPQEKKFKFNNNLALKIKESQLIIIDHFKISNEKGIKFYFTVGFLKTIIIFENSLVSFLDGIQFINPSLSICFLSNTKDLIDNDTYFKYKEIKTDEIFNDEIFNFNQRFEIKQNSHKRIWIRIRSCISGYLIKQSYLKIKNDKINDFLNQNNQQSTIENIHEDDIITLRMIGRGTYFNVNLAYHIEKEELYAVKKPLINIDDSRISHLYKREIENISSLVHPFLPKYIGNINTNNCIVIEFINGRTLSEIEKIHLNFEDKLLIILELMIVLKFLHEKNYIYRDLKPNNIMIDENKNVVLIDFDRMININNTMEDNVFSNDFSSYYVAPEVNLGNFSNKCDMYSLGKLIKYIMKINNDDYSNQILIQDIYKECTQFDPCQRPTISEIIHCFYLYFYSFFYDKDDIYKMIINQNETEVFNKLGCYYIVKNNFHNTIYYFTLAADNGYLLSQLMLGYIYMDNNINKSIHYYTLAANQNNAEAQFQLGYLYYNNQKDMNKAIYYFQLAANQNIPEAQYNLGCILIRGEYVTRNFEKGVYYITLAANQNYDVAQFQLGHIYYEGICVARDVYKAIKYLKLAAKQNYLDAYYILGNIFYDGKYIGRNINKSIYYFTYAANQNHEISQFALGCIYYHFPHKKNIDKAIYYYELSAKKNIPEAQYNLGLIYFFGHHVAKDLNKAIKYFSLAANNNIPMAQFYLGYFYYKGFYFEKNVSKGISYLIDSSKNNCISANFCLGFIYHEGKNVEQNLLKSLHFYKEASSFNCSYSKNNLGIIYKNGFNNIFEKNISAAIDYFKEAIIHKNDCVALYNLANLYIYQYSNEKTINEAIKLLIYSSLNGFEPSMNLLCLILIKKFGLNYKVFRAEIEKNTTYSNGLFIKICDKINDLELYNPMAHDFFYKIYQNIDFLYNEKFSIFLSKKIFSNKRNPNIIERKQIKNVSRDFYEGFGLNYMK